VGQERLGPFYFFISLVLGPLNSLVWYVPSLRYTRGLGWRIHCGVEVTESSTNKQHHRQRGRDGPGGGAGGGVEREQGEESECKEVAKEATGEKEQEVEEQWRRGGGALKFCFRVQG
jgi:hypothetical protein